MTFRKGKHAKATSDDLCLTCDCCACDAQCAHPGCDYGCMGGHANYPESHWCADSHWWKTADTTKAAVSTKRRRR